MIANHNLQQAQQQILLFNKNLKTKNQHSTLTTFFMVLRYAKKKQTEIRFIMP